jgi:hypothetical protein
MKFAALSAALALVTLANGMPTAAEGDLEIRKKDKTGTCAEGRDVQGRDGPCLTIQAGCDAFKKDLKKLRPAASTYCSSFIASTVTVTIPVTTTELVTQTLTVPFATTTTQTTTAATPIVTQTVYPNCGVAGFDNGAPPAYFVDTSGTLATFAACQAKCLEAAGTCQSFAISTSLGACLLYQPNVYVSPISPPALYSARPCSF